jgi:hypothetical protein
MVKYYLIPQSLETLTTQLQTAWLNKSDNAFVCMRGVYKQVQNEVQTEFTTVRNQTPNRNEVSYVFKSYQSLNLENELINYELEYFLLEGELDAQTEYLASLYNIQSFANNQLIITYLQENNLI